MDFIKNFVFFCCWIFFIICIIVTFSKMITRIISNSKYNKLHKISITLLVIGLIINIFIFFKIFNNNESVSKADGFTIEEYKIMLDVDESNVVDVKEYITINFFEDGHHGIYRFIPSWLKYTNKDGITRPREAVISELKAVGDDYKISYHNDKYKIKIGDEDTTIPTGTHTYEIEYKYDMGYDPYEGFDEFIFHAFGDFWGTEIKNVSLIVNLPKKIEDEGKISFYADKYRKDDITSYVNYYVIDNTIYANLSQDYYLDKSLTIDVELPDNYFINGSNHYGQTSLGLCIVCILFAVVSFIIWLKKGKNLEKEPETVEFYPPENLDVAEIGYLNKKEFGKKLAIGLIVSLASKGYIKIIESDDKKTRTIVKSKITDVSRYIKRKIKIAKLKDYKGLNIEHRQLMKKYFSDSDKNVVTSGFDKFYNDSKFLVDKGYIKIESDSINRYSKQKLDSIKESLLLDEFKGMPLMSENEKIVYDELFRDSDETDLAEHQTFYKVFSIIVDNVKNKFDDKINDLSAYKWMIFISLGFLICTLIWNLAYSVIEDLNPKFSVIYIIAFISNMVTFIFGLLMDKKNIYGEKITAKIRGFKSFIEVAEKKQIESMVEKNPNYFFDILPYAYVLGVSKKWVEKFEKIPEPSNDMGNFDYCDVASLDYLSNSVYSSSGSSGCSSCGGGCSSCGGGGSW